MVPDQPQLGSIIQFSRRAEKREGVGIYMILYDMKQSFVCTLLLFAFCFWYGVAIEM